MPPGWACVPSCEPSGGVHNDYLADDVAKETACSGTPRQADLDRAKDLVREAGIDMAKSPLTLVYNDEYGNARTAEAVAQQWREAFGILVELRPMSWGDYEAALVASEGLPGVLRFGWRPVYTSPEQYLAPLFAVEASGTAVLVVDREPGSPCRHHSDGL